MWAYADAPAIDGLAGKGEMGEEGRRDDNRAGLKRPVRLEEKLSGGLDIP